MGGTPGAEPRMLPSALRPCQAIPTAAERDMAAPHRLRVEAEQEEDGSCLAEVVALPGVLAYGATPEEARARAEAPALHVLADRRAQGEPVPEVAGLFEAA